MRLFLCFLLSAGWFSTSLAQSGCPSDFDAFPNLIQNPGFDDGFVGFFSDYKKNTSSNWFSGSIYVTEKPSGVHNNYRLCLDTSLYKDLGKMLVVDGSENRSQIVWQQTLKTEPNVDYFFSCFFATLLKPNPAQLEISINGQRLSKPFDYRYQNCKGNTYFCFWNSGPLTQATISIKTYTTELLGNDYALDNIQFFACKRKAKPLLVKKKEFDSTWVTIKVKGSDSSLTNFKATIAYADTLVENKWTPDSTGLISLPLKNKDIFISIRLKGYFPLKDTLLSHPPYPDSLLIKSYELTRIDSGSHFILKDLTFERSSHVLTDASKKELENVLELLDENPEISLEIHGHTDNQGDALKNYELSVSRVNSVKDYLVEKGIASKRLNGQGFGGTKPLVGYGSDEERRQNRRVEFIVIKQKK
jgi:outer membrane protein OmpA-like peptidoglycan-associated protein